MDAWQTSQQIAYLLEEATWGDSPNARVFPTRESVHVSQGVDERLIGELRYPAAFVVDEGSQADPEEPVIRRQRFTVALLLVHMADRWGEGTLLGSHHSATSGNSTSRGLLEVTTRVMAALDQLGQHDGVTAIGIHASDAKPVGLKNSAIIMQKDVSVELTLEEVRSYPSVRRLAGSVAAGTVTLTWIDPPTRWDSLHIHVRRTTGSVTSFASSAGTQIANVALAAQTTTNSPGAGTFTYGVWGGFDEDRDGTRDRVSSRDGVEVGRFVTVTVP